MTDGVFLGLDLATATARLVAITAGGDVLAETSSPLPAPDQPRPGRAEQAPDYLPVASALLSRLTGRLGRRASGIRALCITGTSGTVVPCEADGRPQGPALLYNDQRATEQASRLVAAGLPASGTSSLARIGWLQRHAPAACYLHTPDVVLAGLLGRVPPTDTSHALKAGIDPVAACWDERALDIVGVPLAAVPELVHPGTALGQVPSEVAAECGLPGDVQVVAGMTDGCTAQLAAGAVRPGDTVGVLGTTLVLKTVSERPVSGFGGAVYSHYAPDGRFWPGGASNVGAGLVKDEFGSADLDQLQQQAATLGPATAVRYPLPGVGERFPFQHPDAVGFQLGETATPAAAFRTLLEGVAFTERLGLEALGASGTQLEAHRVAGGGSRNDLWNRIRATVLDRPVLRPQRASSGIGAALLALASWSGATLVETVDRTQPPGAVFEPDPAERSRLNDSYQRLRTALAERGYLAGCAAEPRDVTSPSSHPQQTNETRAGG
jgi:xylulokinase